MKNLKRVWTGDCEGSYAAMAASTIQDNICITFDRISNGMTVAQRKLMGVKVSFQEVICNCENCHQTHTMGCLGGSLGTTLDYLKTEGFVGGSDFSSKDPFTADGITWRQNFKWNYNNCLGFFKNYCDFKTEAGCGAPAPFNKETHCVAPTAMCKNESSKKLSDSRQKDIFTVYSPRKGQEQINQSLQNGPVVSTMELFSDVLTHPANKVYVPRSTISLGHFAVKIVGHFIDALNGNYWIVQLPLDETVGDMGIIRVRAGQNIGDLEVNAFEVTIDKNLFATAP